MLSWPPVAGAASYRVVILDSGRRPYWAWQGDATSVRVGGAPKRVPRMATGPRVTKGGASGRSPRSTPRAGLWPSARRGR